MTARTPTRNASYLPFAFRVLLGLVIGTVLGSLLGRFCDNILNQNTWQGSSTYEMYCGVFAGILVGTLCGWSFSRPTQTQKAHKASFWYPLTSILVGAPIGCLMDPILFKFQNYTLYSIVSFEIIWLCISSSILTLKLKREEAVNWKTLALGVLFGEIVGSFLAFSSLLFAATDTPIRLAPPVGFILCYLFISLGGLLGGMGLQFLVASVVTIFSELWNAPSQMRVLNVKGVTGTLLYTAWNLLNEESKSHILDIVAALPRRSSPHVSTSYHTPKREIQLMAYLEYPPEVQRFLAREWALLIWGQIRITIQDLND